MLSHRVFNSLIFAKQVNHSPRPMQFSYSSDYLVQMMYRELPPEMVQAVTQMMMQDQPLAAQYASLRKAKSQLPQVQFNPSRAVIDRILKYSAETAVAPC